MGAETQNVPFALLATKILPSSVDISVAVDVPHPFQFATRAGLLLLLASGCMVRSSLEKATRTHLEQSRRRIMLSSDVTKL